MLFFSYIHILLQFTTERRISAKFPVNLQSTGSSEIVEMIITSGFVDFD